MNNWLNPNEERVNYPQSQFFARVKLFRAKTEILDSPRVKESGVGVGGFSRRSRIDFVLARRIGEPSTN